MTNALTDPVWLSVTTALICVLIRVSVVDWRSFRIPDVLSLPLIGAGLLIAWVLPDVAQTDVAFRDHLIGAIGAFVLFAGLGEAIYRRTGQDALGLGDAKLFSASGAWLGWQALPAVLLVASVAGLAYALFVRNRHGTSRIAFGPWIALGFLGVWLSAAMGY